MAAMMAMAPRRSRSATPTLASRPDRRQPRASVPTSPPRKPIRATAEHVRGELGPAIDDSIPQGLSNAALTRHPLAIWVETRLGLKETVSGTWARAEPLRLSEAAERLALDAGRPKEVCRAALQDFLLEASRPEAERVT